MQLAKINSMLYLFFYTCRFILRLHIYYVPTYSLNKQTEIPYAFGYTTIKNTNTGLQIKMCDIQIYNERVFISSVQSKY